MGLYTRQSLYVMLWGFSASTLLAAALDPDNDEPAGALVAGGLVVTFAAFMAFVPMLRSVERLPWRRLLPLFGVSAAYVALAVAAWSDVARGSALLVAVVALVVVLATLHGRAIAVALVLGSGLLFGLVGGEPQRLRHRRARRDVLHLHRARLAVAARDRQGPRRGQPRQGPARGGRGAPAVLA